MTLLARAVHVERKFTRSSWMNDLIRERLVNQKLAARARDPVEIVSSLGAIQAQDFHGATWAIGVRSNTLTDAAVVRAYDEGRILRTHVLRPTWHFVAAADIRWLVALTGPRILARMAYRHRQLGIDPPTIARSQSALRRALAKTPHTRRDIAAVLRRAGVPVTPERISHLVMVAELAGLLCSGPLRDGQVTWALMDDRVPRAPSIDPDTALARLAGRYFRSHGPATLADFAWWSGLSRGDARSAVEMAGLSRDAVVDGMYRRGRRPPRRSGVTPSEWLLPNYDEYLVAYTDRSAVLGDCPVDPRLLLDYTVVIDGFALGTWRPRRRNGSVSIAVTPRRRLTRDEQERVRRAADRYGAFVGSDVEVERLDGRQGTRRAR